MKYLYKEFFTHECYLNAIEDDKLQAYKLVKNMDIDISENSICFNHRYIIPKSMILGGYACRDVYPISRGTFLNLVFQDGESLAVELKHGDDRDLSLLLRHLQALVPYADFTNQDELWQWHRKHKKEMKTNFKLFLQNNGNLDSIIYKFQNIANYPNAGRFAGVRQEHLSETRSPGTFKEINSLPGRLVWYAFWIIVVILFIARFILK